MADGEFICNLMCFICRLDLHNFPFHRSSIFPSRRRLFPHQLVHDNVAIRSHEWETLFVATSFINHYPIAVTSHTRFTIRWLTRFALSIGKAKARFSPTHVSEWQGANGALRTTFGPDYAENEKQRRWWNNQHTIARWLSKRKKKCFIIVWFIELCMWQESAQKQRRAAFLEQQQKPEREVNQIRDANLMIGRANERWGWIKKDN